MELIGAVWLNGLSHSFESVSSSRFESVGSFRSDGVGRVDLVWSDRPGWVGRVGSGLSGFAGQVGLNGSDRSGPSRWWVRWTFTSAQCKAMRRDFPLRIALTLIYRADLIKSPNSPHRRN